MSGWWRPGGKAEERRALLGAQANDNAAKWDASTREPISLSARALSRSRILAFTSLPVAAVLLVGCSSSTTGPQPASGGSQASTTSVTLTREVTHIHGAGFDPADGVVYAGTHEGVWKVTGAGDVSLVGTPDDDFMGFSIASADNWVSSGHPGATSKAANPLGLIHSSDKGQTWKQVSLAGQTDFHALAANDTNVVGYAADGAVMSSADGGTSWTTGASVSVASLAFSGDTLLATSRQGLLRSTDSGKSFAPVPSAPKAVLLSVGSAGSVWCVDTGGTAWSSADAGKTWTQRAQVGEVSALAAVDATTSYAITPTTLVKVS